MYCHLNSLIVETEIIKHFIVLFNLKKMLTHMIQLVFSKCYISFVSRQALLERHNLYKQMCRIKTYIL